MKSYLLLGRQILLLPTIVAIIQMFVSVNKEKVVFSVDDKSITDQILHSENSGGNSPHS